MNNNTNILSLLVGITACYFLTSKFGNSEVKETFLNHPRTIKTERVAQFQRNGQTVSQALPANANIRSSNQQMLGVQQMANVGLASSVRQQQVRRAQQPSIVSGNVIEPFTKQNAGCRVNQQSQMASANMSHQQMPHNVEISNSLPVQAMGDGILNNLGEMSSQPIIYDRYIYANQRSRQYGQGDPIRGDLPIVPECNSWFRPSANPQTDLRDGAVQSMFGNGETSNEMLALRNASVDGLLSVGAGATGNARVAHNPYMANGTVQTSSQLSSSGGVQVTMFP